MQLLQLPYLKIVGAFRSSTSAQLMAEDEDDAGDGHDGGKEGMMGRAHHPDR